eukprot:scaffold13207_cov143-Cylindrotheca_fusiformis.AAC.4
MSCQESTSTMSSGVSTHFPIHRKSVVLNGSVTENVVRFAEKRIQKSNIIAYAEESSSSSNVDLLRHSQIDLGSALGHGSFSSVFEIRKIRCDEKEYDSDALVVKVLRPCLAAKPTLLAACAADIVFEGTLLSTLNHRNIVSLKAMSLGGVYSFASGRHDAFFLVMERLQETLEDKIARWQHQSETALFFRTKKAVAVLADQMDAILQLGNAMQHLHSKGIMYRDAKPANIGFDEEGTLKIFDFDVAKIIPQSNDPNETFLLTKRTGSPRYMAPEVGKGEKYNLKADVYSFSLVCHEIMSFEKPFDNIPSSKVDQAVFYDGVRPEIRECWPKGFQEFLRNSWSTDIPTRPTMTEAIAILRKELGLMLSTLKTSKKRRMPWNLKRIKTSPMVPAAA